MPQDDLKINSVQPDIPVRERSVTIAAPGPGVSMGDLLRFAVSSTITGVTISYEGRIMLPNGEFSPWREDVVVTAVGNQTVRFTPVADGWIVGLCVYVSAGTVLDGQVAVSVEVVRNIVAVVDRVYCLASGFVTNIKSLGIGGFTAIANAPSSSFLVGANPAAGAEISDTIPAGPRWQLFAVNYTLVTSATVATRFSQVRVSRSGTELVRFVPASSQTASLTILYPWSQASGNASLPATVIPSVLGPIPVLEPGDVISTITIAIQAGDDYSAPTYFFSAIP